jgi:hypothetical protein
MESGGAGRSATGLWHQVLYALKNPEVGDTQRQELLALDAAELALARAEEQSPVTAADVQRTASTSFRSSSTCDRRVWLCGIAGKPGTGNRESA